MLAGERRSPQRTWHSSYAILSILVCITAVLAIVNAQERAWARARDLVATPVLMGSPLQVIESRMRAGEIQWFESQMLDSPLQLIGSPFGSYRFATLPNLQDFWATRRSISLLPGMFQTPQGMLLMLPPYVLLFTNSYPVYPVEPPEDAIVPSVPARAVAPPKFFSSRCGQFEEIAVPPGGILADEENKPC